MNRWKDACQNTMNDCIKCKVHFTLDSGIEHWTTMIFDIASFITIIFIEHSRLPETYINVNIGCG